MTVTEESPYVWVDAEIEQRLNLLVSWARTAGENSTEEVTDTELALREAFRDVFRVVNAQREAAVREALEEHEPSADEIEAGARRLWSELPGEAYRDYELGMVATDWNDARHESQVTYRNVVVDVCKAMAEWRMTPAKEAE